MLLVDKNDEIERQLKGLPRPWLDPLSRYVRREQLRSGELKGSWIGCRRDGTTERVRCAVGESRSLLLAERDALQKVRHENVIQLRWAACFDRKLYVATSWIDVEERTDWPIPIRTLLSQMECAATGVAALHAAGLVHGDLKPETILWHGDRALITDLKLAAPAGRRERSSYSPKFAAPEQILQQPVGPQADVYALGVTLYTLFARDRFPSLLKAEDPSIKSSKSKGLSATTAFRHLKDGANHADQDWVVGAKVLFRSRLSGVLQGAQDANLIGSVLSIVLRACDLNPEKRYSDAAALADALRELRSRVGSN